MKRGIITAILTVLVLIFFFGHHRSRIYEGSGDKVDGAFNGPVSITLHSEVADRWPASALLQFLSEAPSVEKITAKVEVEGTNSMVFNIIPRSKYLQLRNPGLLSVKCEAGSLYVNDELSNFDDLVRRLRIFKEASILSESPLLVGFSCDKDFDIKSFIDIHDAINRSGDFGVVFLGEVSTIKSND